MLDASRLLRAMPLPALVLRADPPRFTVVEASDTLLAAAHAERDGPASIVGRGLFEAFPRPPHDPDGVEEAATRSALEAVVTEGRAVTAPLRRYAVRRSDGAWDDRWWRTTRFPLLDDAGRVAYVVSLPVDVTGEVVAGQERERAEAEYRAALDRLDGPYVTLDDAGRVVFANSAARDALPAGERPVVGARWLGPDAPDGTLRALLRTHVARGTAGVVQIPGEWRWLAVQVAPTAGGVTLLLRDATAEHRRAEALALLADAGRELAGARELQPTLEAIARLALPVLGDLCVIDLTMDEVDRDGGAALWRAASAHTLTAKHELIQAHASRFAAGAANRISPSARVLATGQALLIPEVPNTAFDAHPDPEFRRLVWEVGPRSLISVPMRVRGAVLGVLSFGVTESARRLDAEDLAVAEEFAGRAAVAIENVRLLAAERAARAEAEAALQDARRAHEEAEGLRHAAQDAAVEAELSAEHALRLSRDAERARDDVQAGEARARFLVTLGDAMREADDPDAVVRLAMEHLRAHVRADHVGYSQFAPDGASYRIVAVCSAPDAPSLQIPAGALSLDALGPQAAAALRAGLPFAVDDVPARRVGLPRTEAPDGSGAQRVGAMLRVPLHRGGRITAGVAVARRTPYAWPAEEITLVQEVAARCYDAIARAHAARELAASEARFRGLVERAHEGVWTVDLDGRTTYLNPRMSELLGLGEADALGRALIDFAAEGSEAEARALLADVAEVGRTTELRLRRCDGSTMFARVAVSRLSDALGVPTGLLALVADVTPERAAERRRQQDDDDQRFLATLTAALQASTDPVVVGATAVEQLGRRFDAPCDWILADAAGGGPIVQQAWPAGDPVRDAGTPATPLAVAVERAGRAVGAFRLHGASERSWSARERALLREAVERSWSALEVTRLLRTADEERRRLAAVLETLPVGVAIVDRQGALLLANARMHEIWGGAPGAAGIDEYAQYRGWWANTGRELTPEEWAIARAVLHGESARNDVVEIARFDGGRRVILVNGAPIRDADGAVTGGIAAFADITEQHRLTAAVREGEARFRTLFDALPVGAAVFDPDSARILMANPYLQALVGYDAEELGRLGPADLVEGTSDDEGAAVLRAVVAGSTPVRRAVRLRTREGGPRDVLATLAPVTMDGAPRIYAIPVDVTDLRAANRALEQLAAELEQRVAERTAALEESNRRLEGANQRLAEQSARKSAFVAHMSHEIRTPLNAILGFCELLHDGVIGPVTEEQRDCLNDVLTSGRHLLRIVDDVLDVARIEAGRLQFRRENVPVARAVGDLVGAMRATADSSQVALHAEVAPELARTTIRTDAGRLRQVLYNYVSNALKWTPAGGTVVVRATTTAAGGVRFAVVDTGRGIAAADLPRLFKSFEQLDEGAERGGTGLGLAVTRQIVEAQGGAVGVESAPGVGSTFWADFPPDQA